MTMQVFVQVWCEIDPSLNVRIDRQTGLAVADPGDNLQRVSPLGRAGVDAALSLRAGAVTVFALGAGLPHLLQPLLDHAANTEPAPPEDLVFGDGHSSTARHSEKVVSLVNATVVFGGLGRKRIEIR